MPPDPPYEHHNDGPPTPPEGFNVLSCLRLRFWIGGQLRDEVWIDADDPGSADLAGYCATYHAAQAEMADLAGIPWLDRVYNPELPEDQAYIRIGTDRAGMTRPAPLNGQAQ